MLTEKKCYMCKYLLFFECTASKGYYCTLTGSNYVDGSTNCNCNCYCEEYEE